MKNSALVEFSVGIFIILGVIALFVLALKVSGMDPFILSKQAVRISADFDEIGDLKIRAPVKIAGVRIGEVENIQLDAKDFRAHVTMVLDQKQSAIPIDSTASILAVSLLGSNYIAITPGFSEQMLKNGEEITETYPAIILANLIGKAIFTPKEEKTK